MRLLFVCTGNICRSPTADAIARQRVIKAGLDWQIDSAGTGGWHVGETPDARAVEAGAARGYDLSVLSAREICPDEPGADVPDPYYGNADGFEGVLDMIERGVDGLVAAVGKDQSSG